MAGNGNSNERLAAAEKAARFLRLAKRTGEPQDHVEVLYAEVAKAADTILEKHPAATFKPAQLEAMTEIIAAAILMTNEASRQPPSWFGKLWREYCDKSPMVQVGIALGTFGAVLAFTAGIAGAWYATPKTLRWVADIVSQWVPADAEQSESTSPPEASEPAEEPTPQN